MLHDHRKVLIPTQVRGPGTADLDQGTCASGLRPAIAIKVSQQTLITPAVHVNGSAKSRGRQHTFHLRTAAVVLAPFMEELFLSFAQKLQARQVDALWIIRGIIDVIRPRSHLRNLACGSALELPIFQDGKVDPTDDHAGEVNLHIAIHIGRIDRVRQMP